MSINRRLLLQSMGAAGIALAASRPAWAADYPAKPITILAGFAAGGTTDAAARLYADEMSKRLGVPVLVENKPGGYQLPVIRQMLGAKPDGYTLWAASASALTLNPALRSNLIYDVDRDFTLISRLLDNPAVLFVDARLPITSIPELVAFAEKNPDTFNYAQAGIGSAGHIYTEAFIAAVGMTATGITYGTDAEVVREIIAGNCQMAVMATLNTMPMIQAGKLRPLMVTTQERLAILPEVQSLPETGIEALSGLSPYTFIALAGPKDMPDDILQLLNKTIVEIAATPEVQKKIRETLFSEPSASSPEEFKAFVKSQIGLWAPLKEKLALPEI